MHNLNKKAYEILEGIINEENLRTEEFDNGTVKIIDAGVNLKPSPDIGIKVAEASMGCLGKVRIDNALHVRIDELPSVAALSSQLAGWCINIDGKNALGSGPARILAKKPKSVIDRIGYSETSDKAALILETPILPDRKTYQQILEETNSHDVIIAAFSENSLTGVINILSRVVEVGIFRLFNLGYDVGRISQAEGSVPMIEPSRKVMFEANDAIIQQGFVRLKVNGWNPELTKKAVSKASIAYGKPFETIFKDACGDFYKIPADLFAPARLEVTDVRGEKVYKLE